MSATSPGDARRYRRRILTIGVIALGLTYVVGARWYLDSVESDLERRVPDELAVLGYSGISALFDGQDGTLSCTDPLPDPEAAREAAYDVWGVRAIELDRSCRVKADGPSDPDPESVASVPTTSPGDTAEVTTSTPAPVFDTVADALAGSPQLSLFAVLVQEAELTAEFGDQAMADVTVFAPADSAFELLPADVLAELRADPEELRTVLMHHLADGRLLRADFGAGQIEMRDGDVLAVDSDEPSIGGVPITVSDVEAGNGVVHVLAEVLVPGHLDVSDAPAPATVDVTLEADAMTLSGVASTEAVRAILRNAAAGEELEVVDELTVDVETGLDATTAGDLAALVVAMRTYLVAGVAGFDGEALFLTGTFASSEDRDAASSAAAEVGVTAELVERPDTSFQAAALEGAMNTYVADHPILFERDATIITEASGDVLDRLAELASAVDGVFITVQGHTDSDGEPDDNLRLSQSRAYAVMQGLIARGVPAESIGYEGFGSQQPVLVAGAEDKVASRRVEFAVEAAS